jgi:hypothetical protein
VYNFVTTCLLEDGHGENKSQVRYGEVEEQNQVIVTNKSAAVENLEDSGDINRAWGVFRKNINISA